jgi:hypothetical protein
MAILKIPDGSQVGGPICVLGPQLLAQLREKLLGWKQQLLPKHPMAEAINYALNQRRRGTDGQRCF